MRSSSSAVTSRAPQRFNTRLDMVCSFRVNILPPYKWTNQRYTRERISKNGMALSALGAGGSAPMHRSLVDIPGNVLIRFAFNHDWANICALQNSWAAGQWRHGCGV